MRRIVYPPLILVLLLFGLFIGFLYSQTGTQFVLRYFLERNGIVVSSVRSVDGNLLTGLKMEGLVVRGFMGPFDLSKVTIGEVRARVTFPLNFTLVVNNGKFIQRVSEPLIFYGSIRNGMVDVTIYSRSLELKKLFSTFFKRVEFVQKLDGRADNINAYLTGPIESPMISGNFFVPELRYKEFMARDLLVDVNFSLMTKQDKLEIYGGLYFNGGVISNPTSAKLALRKRSRLYFRGEPTKPEYDFAASAKVGKVAIDVKFTGERSNLIMSLSSEPKLPQGQLLMLVLTNRTWDAASSMLSGEGMSSNLAAEVIDYFVFGNSGQKLFDKIGLNVSAQVSNRGSGLSVKKSFGDLSVEAARVYSNSANSNSASSTQENKVSVRFLREF